MTKIIPDKFLANRTVNIVELLLILIRLHCVTLAENLPQNINIKLWFQQHRTGRGGTEDRK